MSVPLMLRDDFSAGDVRVHARRCKDGAQVRQLLAIATILDGGSRSDAALIGGVTRQIVRDWVVRFNADWPGGLATRKAPGPQTILNDGHRRALEEIIEAGPIPAVWIGFEAEPRSFQAIRLILKKTPRFARVLIGADRDPVFDQTSA